MEEFFERMEEKYMKLEEKNKFLANFIFYSIFTFFTIGGFALVLFLSYLIIATLGGIAGGAIVLCLVSGLLGAMLNI